MQIDAHVGAGAWGDRHRDGAGEEEARRGTGEGATFPRSTLDKMLDAAFGACETLFAVQREALALPYPGVLPEGPAPKKAFGS